ncbi:hypothetical protein CR513_41567, partial [Mucuna pruriens]
MPTSNRMPTPKRSYLYANFKEDANSKAHVDSYLDADSKVHANSYPDTNFKADIDSKSDDDFYLPHPWGPLDVVPESVAVAKVTSPHGTTLVVYHSMKDGEEDFVYLYETMIKDQGVTIPFNTYEADDL